MTTNVTGLFAGGTYHFRIVAVNSDGVATVGDDQYFTTTGGSPPTATTGTAGNVGSTAATLNGIVNPNGRQTKYHFEYGTSTSYGQSSSEQFISGTGTTGVPVSSGAGTLSPSTTYHFRLVADNIDQATSYGADQTFTTTAGPIAPSVTTGTPTGVSSAGATLNGTVNPNGAQTSYIYQYGTTTSYGSQQDGPQFVGSGTTAHPAPETLSGLDPGTTYHVRIVASNINGQTSNGEDETFTTSTASPTGAAPTVTTGTPTGVSSDRATLNGTVNPNGVFTNYTYQYGPTTSYHGSNQDGPQFIGSGTTALRAPYTLKGLTPGTTYHVRIEATNSKGQISHGEDETFTTSSTSPPTPKPKPVVPRPAPARPT